MTYINCKLLQAIITYVYEEEQNYFKIYSSMEPPKFYEILMSYDQHGKK
jgi:hypothetical protein